MLFKGLMKLFKKILALLLTVVMTMSISCGMNNSKTSRNVIYKNVTKLKPINRRAIYFHICA